MVREGLRGAAAAELFDGLCQRLVIAGVPLWRAFVGMPTLHPQWGGYSYTWRRDLNAIEPAQFGRGDEYEQSLQNSPFSYLIRQMEDSAPEEDPWRYLRRRLAGPEAKFDFPILNELAAAGAADYFAEVIRFGASGTLPAAPVSVIHSPPTCRRASMTTPSRCCGPCSPPDRWR